MPRKKKILKKGTKRPIHKYSEESLNQALVAIRSNNMKIREASRVFGVLRGTIQDRIHGRVAEKPRKMGPNTILTAQEENKLCEWLITLAKVGFGRKKHDVLNTVQKIVADDQRSTPFKNGRPGDKWYAKFLERHPTLSQRTAESVTMGRAVITEESIRCWFRDLHSYLESINCLDILDDPTRILNGDETSFSLCPKTGKVLGPKGWRNIYDCKKGNEKETITVLLVFSADGKVATPMVVFPYVKPPKDIINSVPKDWFLGKSETGWMKSNVFFEYIANGLNDWIMQNNIKKPVLLFIDGHKSHLTLELSEFCDQNGIILYALLPNTTHILQPADVSVFKPLKDGWKKAVGEWQNKPDNFNKVVTKATFSPLLKNVLSELDLEKAIKNGFRLCGLFPYNPNNVDYTKCIQNQLENLSARHDPNIILNRFTRQQADVACFVIRSIANELKSKHIDPDLIINEVRKVNVDMENKQRSSEIGIDRKQQDEINTNGEVEIEEYLVESDGNLTNIAVNNKATVNDHFNPPSTSFQVEVEVHHIPERILTEFTGDNNIISEKSTAERLSATADPNFTWS